MTGPSDLHESRGYEGPVGARGRPIHPRSPMVHLA